MKKLQTKVRQSQVKEGKKQSWEVSDVEPQSPTPLPRPTPKPIDEDLYKISPAFLYSKAKKVSSTLPLKFKLEASQSHCPMFNKIVLYFDAIVHHPLKF